TIMQNHDKTGARLHKRMKSTDIQTQSFLAHFQRIVNAENFVNRFFAQASASFRGMGNRIRKRTHAT
ncbi:TPA: hypothetical protein ACFM5D_002224, partial [Neisseria meningitidis]